MINDTSGQISAELILILAGMIAIVTIALSIYNSYLEDFSNEINKNEVKNLNSKIDNITNFLK